ncbi:MAG TPA: ABC transporter ATP-binding protein [Clostridiaceae bacterium]|nr:ABC transporter ATP-binding protein [Clostridiaceae bacterium]
MHGAGGARGGLSEDERVDGKIYDFKLIKKMSRFAKPYLHLFLAALILILAVSSSRLARPYITKIAIDEYMSKGLSGELPTDSARKGLYTLGVLFFGLVVMEFAFSYLHTYILNLAGKKIVMNLRDRIFRHIQKLPVSYFDKNPVGKIVTRVTNDTDSLNEMFTNVIVSLMQDIFVMIGVVAIMLSLSVRLTIISFLVLPVMTLATYMFRKKAREIFQEIRARLANLNAFLAEHVSGMKLIQVFNMQDKKCDEFEKTNKEYYDSNRKRIILHGLFRPFMDVVNSLAIALILWFGGRDIISGILEFGTLYAFTNYINQFFQPIMNLTEIYNTMQSSMVSAERIFDLLEEKPEPEPEDDDTIELKEIRGEIEFKNVWFAYVGENWVLKDVSFKINPGETAAFVGATGAGKTSIINLICGFYEIQKGDIFIDGINLKKIKKTALRKNIGLVLQDVFLFSGDIETNIKLFEEGITFDKVKKAAEYVNADYFISRFPEGYKHPVNEKGTTLSAGQRQLLSFARALVFDPAILVLDEATSNIDTETEILIQKALVKLLSGRTSIAIAHRLSTIQKADKILVIHKGTIRESGSHQELLEKKGLYYNLYKLQYDGEDIDTIMNEIA